MRQASTTVVRLKSLVDRLETDYARGWYRYLAGACELLFSLPTESFRPAASTKGK